MEIAAVPKLNEVTPEGRWDRSVPVEQGVVRHRTQRNQGATLVRIVHITEGELQPLTPTVLDCIPRHTVHIIPRQYPVQATVRSPSVSL